MAQKKTKTVKSPQPKASAKSARRAQGTRPGKQAPARPKSASKAKRTPAVPARVSTRPKPSKAAAKPKAPARPKQATKAKPASKPKPAPQHKAPSKVKPKSQPKSSRAPQKKAPSKLSRAAERLAKTQAKAQAKAQARSSAKAAPAAKKPAKPKAAKSPGAGSTPIWSAPVRSQRSKPLPPRPPAPVPAPPVGVSFPAEFLAEQRSRLETKKAEILALYRKDLKSGQESNDGPTEDIVDRANNAYSRELAFSISDAERNLLVQIEEAIARVDAGTYGFCAHTGQPIGRARLEALPWARFSIEAQELLEKGLLTEA